MSSLPKLTESSFVIGFVLPVVLAFCGVSVIWPSISESIPFLRAISFKGPIEGSDIGFLIVTAWVFAIFLTTTNTLQYRILEGYLPPLSNLKILTSRQRRKCNRLAENLIKLEENSIQNTFSEATNTLASVDEISSIRMRLVNEFPFGYPNLVLPTKFGNAIRAFETYPNNTYGADGVLIWPRLITVVPKDFLKFVDDAKAQVDCFVNAFFLSFLIGIAALIDAFFKLWQNQFNFSPNLLNLILNENNSGERVGLFSIVMFILALLFYFWSIKQIANWSDLVKATFDCFLPALAEKLGYKLPNNQKERFEFWVQFSSLIAYLKPLSADRWSYVGPSEVSKTRDEPRSDKNGESGSDPE